MDFYASFLLMLTKSSEAIYSQAVSEWTISQR